VKPARDSWINPALALLLCAAAGTAFAWLKTPLPWMLGPLVAMALCNFAGGALRYVAGVLASVIIVIALSAGFALALAWISDISWPTLVLALAPGGIAEMCITAKVLQLGVPLVTAAHVIRVLILITTTGPSFRAARQLRKRFRLT
jgi:uncharacterized membrane protein AbrB (regulator of aidB expression)